MKKVIRNLIISFIVFVSIICFVIIAEGFVLYKNAIEEVSVDKKVNELIEKTDNFVKYGDLPENYINAVIAVEDKDFFSHNGIQIQSIGRALITDIKERSFAEGGSTITQQLAKNTYFTQKKEFTRKIAEVFMAFEFEKKLSKEEIFELYVNTIYFGDGYYGIYDACHGYFDKDVSEMDLYECTMIAGIPNAPSVYAPTKNPELAKQRQEQVLYKMIKYNYLSQSEGDKIVQTQTIEGDE